MASAPGAAGMPARGTDLAPCEGCRGVAARPRSGRYMDRRGFFPLTNYMDTLCRLRRYMDKRIFCPYSAARAFDGTIESVGERLYSAWSWTRKSFSETFTSPAGARKSSSDTFVSPARARKSLSDTGLRPGAYGFLLERRVT